MGDILVGTASWTDKTLLETDWYPPDVRTAEERLKFYASRFPLVEVDSTYYAPPAERTVGYWRDRTPPGFTFNVKAFSLLTQHPTRPTALYKELRERVPDKKTLYLRDVPDDVAEEVWRRFLESLWPLHEAGRSAPCCSSSRSGSRSGGRTRSTSCRRNGGASRCASAWSSGTTPG
ncbi:hypothetical protein GCM10029978_036300 [Actinoallomurus acanthiterrae]